MPVEGMAVTVLGFAEDGKSTLRCGLWAELPELVGLYGECDACTILSGAMRFLDNTPASAIPRGALPVLTAALLGVAVALGATGCERQLLRGDFELEQEHCAVNQAECSWMMAYSPPAWAERLAVE